LLDSKSKGEQIQEELKAALYNTISDARKNINTEVIKVYLDLNKERKDELIKAKGVKFDKVRDNRYFTWLFSKEIEQIKEIEKKLAHEYLIDKLENLFKEYQLNLSKLGLGPSDEALKNEKRLWQLKFEENLPVEMRKFYKIKDSTFATKELWDEYQKILSNAPVKCKFNGKEVFWYPVEKIVFGRVENADMIIYNRAFKKVPYTIGFDSKGAFINAKRKETKEKEMLFLADGAPVYSHSNYRLRSKGRIVITNGFFMDYFKEDGFVMFVFGWDEEFVESGYGMKIDEVWQDYQYFKEKKFLVGGYKDNESEKN